jgi:hypothetical protein
VSDWISSLLAFVLLSIAFALIAYLHLSRYHRQARRLRDGRTRIARCWFKGEEAPYPDQYRRGQLEFRHDGPTLISGPTVADWITGVRGDQIIVPTGGLTLWGVDVPSEWALRPFSLIPRTNYLELACDDDAGREVWLLMPEPLSNEVRRQLPEEWQRLHEAPDGDL